MPGHADRAGVGHEQAAHGHRLCRGRRLAGKPCQKRPRITPGAQSTRHAIVNDNTVGADAKNGGDRFGDRGDELTHGSTFRLGVRGYRGQKERKLDEDFFSLIGKRALDYLLSLPFLGVFVKADEPYASLLVIDTSRTVKVRGKMRWMQDIPKARCEPPCGGASVAGVHVRRTRSTARVPKSRAGNHILNAPRAWPRTEVVSDQFSVVSYQWSVIRPGFAACFEGRVRRNTAMDAQHACCCR